MSLSFSDQTAGQMDNPSNAMVMLPQDYAPGDWDVICQRGKEYFDHIGNKRFRTCIDTHLDNYIKVKSRQEKSRIVTTIVENIKKNASVAGGGFIRKDLLTRRWYMVGDKLAREKVGQALRDAIKVRRASAGGNKRSTPGTNVSRKTQSTHEAARTADPSPIAELDILPLNPRGLELDQAAPDNLWSMLSVDNSNQHQPSAPVASGPTPNTVPGQTFPTDGLSLLPNQRTVDERLSATSKRRLSLLGLDIEPTPIMDLVKRQKLSSGDVGGGRGVSRGVLAKQPNFFSFPEEVVDGSKDFAGGPEGFGVVGAVEQALSHLNAPRATMDNLYPSTVCFPHLANNDPCAGGDRRLSLSMVGFQDDITFQTLQSQQFSDLASFQQTFGQL